MSKVAFLKTKVIAKRQLFFEVWYFHIFDLRKSFSDTHIFGSGDYNVPLMSHGDCGHQRFLFSFEIISTLNYFPLLTIKYLELEENSFKDEF